MYPPKIDIAYTTWVIAFDVNLSKLYEYSRMPEHQNILNNKTPDVLVRDLRSEIFNEIYNVLSRYNFDKRLQNSLVFNNKQDATLAYKAISLGLSNSWTKYFIEKIHLFQVEPNSDAIELLNKNQIISKENRPSWLCDDLLEFMQKNDSFDDDLLLF